MEKTLINIQIITLFLLLFLLIYTIIYIRELKTCICFQQNDKYKVNLEFLEFYQYLELFSLIILFVSLFFTNKSMNKMFSSGKKGKVGSIGGFFSLFLLTIITIVYFIIKYNVMTNVYNLSRSITSDCECGNKWERFFLYYQGIVSGVEVVHYLIGFLVLILLLITGAFRSITK